MTKKQKYHHDYYLKRRAELLLKQKEYYLKNRDQILDYQRQFRQTNSVQVRTAIRAWWKRNKKKIYNRRKMPQYLAWQRNYSKVNRARRRSTALKADSFTQQEWLGLLEFFENRCAYCGKKYLRLEPDHVVPVSKNGLNDIGNILPACRSCNAAKHNKSLEVFDPDYAAHMKSA